MENQSTLLAHFMISETSLIYFECKNGNTDALFHQEHVQNEIYNTLRTIVHNVCALLCFACPSLISGHFFEPVQVKHPLRIGLNDSHESLNITKTKTNKIWYICWIHFKTMESF